MGHIMRAWVISTSNSASCNVGSVKVKHNLLTLGKPKILAFTLQSTPKIVSAGLAPEYYRAYNANTGYIHTNETVF